MISAPPSDACAESYPLRHDRLQRASRVVREWLKIDHHRTEDTLAEDELSPTPLELVQLRMTTI
jgi:hypothetical protein